MADFSSSDAYLEALNSEQIVLVVGEKAERMSVAKGILCKKSRIISALVVKTEDKAVLDMRKEKVPIVKDFIQWCYKESLPPLPPASTSSQQMKWKDALIDMWIFAGRHEITTLQNEAMRLLIPLLDNSTLFTAQNVHYIWQHTRGLTYELRTLATLLMVAKIQSDADDTTADDLDGFAKLKGFVSEIYSATEEWTKFKVPESPRKDKRSKWLKFTADKEIRYLLMVQERPEQEQETPPPAQPAVRPPAAGGNSAKTNAKVSTEAKQDSKPAVVVKKEQQDDDEVQQIPTRPKNREIVMVDLTGDDDLD